MIDRKEETFCGKKKSFKEGSIFLNSTKQFKIFSANYGCPMRKIILFNNKYLLEIRKLFNSCIKPLQNLCLLQMDTTNYTQYE